MKEFKHADLKKQFHQTFMLIRHCYSNTPIQLLELSKNICVSRPRRFGKPITVSMLTAYYDRIIK